MRKTRKLQVTLEEQDYERVAFIARREGKKMAAVVRESISKYVLDPETDRLRRNALRDLLALPPTPVPTSYREWEREYGALKLKRGKSKV